MKNNAVGGVAISKGCSDQAVKSVFHWGKLLKRLTEKKDARVCPIRCAKAYSAGRTELALAVKKVLN